MERPAFKTLLKLNTVQLQKSIFLLDVKTVFDPDTVSNDHDIKYMHTGYLACVIESMWYIN